MPARTSKIFTAGASATALFSMVAAMGWQSGTSAAKSSDSIAPAEEPVPTVAEVVPVTPTTAPSTTQVSLMPSVDDDAPVVVVPKAIAVTTLPVQKTTKHKSHTTTKTSG